MHFPGGEGSAFVCINDGTDGNVLGLLMGGNNAHIPAHDLQTHQIAGERSVLFQDEAFWANADMHGLIRYSGSGQDSLGADV